MTSSATTSSTAVALVRPSPFDILPAPPPRAKHVRNQRRLSRLANSLPSPSGGWWQHPEADIEIRNQLEAEGFVLIDAFAGLAYAHSLRLEVITALEAAATRGGLSGGGAATVLRGDHTLWATSRGIALEALLRRLDALVPRSIGSAVGPDDVLWRSDPQFSVYPANQSRYVRHVDNTCTGGRGRLCNGRLLTAVYYLNPAWEASAGGELRISRPRRDDDGIREAVEEAPELDVAPLIDRLALFWADSRTPHEVLPSAALRHAVTVWFFSEAQLDAAPQQRGWRETLGLHRVAAAAAASPAPAECPEWTKTE